MTEGHVMTTWFHFIGRAHQFIAPAQQFGVSRNCPANVAKMMEFGDRVICLEWRGKAIPPAAFAEFVITGISFRDSDINVGEELLKQDRCEYEDYSAGGGGGISVDRECGSFTLAGCYSLKEDVTIAEIFEIAEKQVNEKGGSVSQLHCMIWGKLTKVYDVPMTVVPAPLFMRGFTRVSDGARIGDAPIVAAGESAPNQIVVVQDYQRI